jgi:hypothetical protein
MPGKFGKKRLKWEKNMLDQERGGALSRLLWLLRELGLRAHLNPPNVYTFVERYATRHGPYKRVE